MSSVRAKVAARRDHGDHGHGDHDHGPMMARRRTQKKRVARATARRRR
jgi:hypothetical protein